MSVKTGKILSIILCIALIGSVFTLAASAAEYSTESRPLAFNGDSTFKILHITDLHMHDSDDSVQKTSEYMIKRLVQSENPDVVVITGDIAMNDTKERTIENIDNLMNIFDEAGVPVAVTFGNHDTEKGLFTREELLSVYMRHESSIAVDDGDILPGAGTYNVPIMSSDGSKVAFNLWIIDSGDYDTEDHYASVDPAITSWYVEKSNSLRENNGGENVNSLMFQHIIVPEIYDALNKASLLNPFAVKNLYSNDKYVLNPDNTNSGRLVETPCPGYYNLGQFEAVTGQGDVLAMFFGHDHSNTFSVNYKGVDLVATPKAQCGVTNDNGIIVDISDASKGGRVITLNENDTSSYESHVVTFGSLITAEEAFNNSGASDFEQKTASHLYFSNNFYNMLLRLRAFFGAIFSLCSVDFG